MSDNIVETVQAALARQPVGSVLTTRELVAATGLTGEQGRLFGHKLFAQGASARLSVAGLYRQGPSFTRYGRATRRRYWSLVWGRLDDDARIAAAEARQSMHAKRGAAQGVRGAKLDDAKLDDAEARLARLEVQVTRLAKSLETVVELAFTKIDALEKITEA